MSGIKTILLTAVFLLTGSITLGNPENRHVAAGRVSIVFLPDIQYNDQNYDADVTGTI